MLSKGEFKTRANVSLQEYSIGLGVCMSVASENRDSWVTTYSVNKFCPTLEFLPQNYNSHCKMHLKGIGIEIT